MNKYRKTAWMAALAAFVLCFCGAVPSALAEEPSIVAEAPTAGDYSGDADGGLEFFEDLFDSIIDSETEMPSKEPTPAPTAVPLPTEEPQEAEPSYSVVFVLSEGWTNAAKVIITAHIQDENGTGLQRVEYSLNNSWQDVTAEYFMSPTGEIPITVRDNGPLTVRITDPHGGTFEDGIQVNSFDRTVPTLQARIDGENLHVQVSDDLSGAAGIQVNGLLFTAVENGVLDVRIPDVLSKYDHLAIRAFDYAGNFSDPITLDNPFYQTGTPTKSPQGTKTPGTSDSTPEPIATDPPVYGPTAEPYVQPVVTPEPQIIYVTPEPPVATPTPIIQTEYVPIGPGMPYMADGNGHTLDVLYSAATNKQFITMQTKAGNTFYLVIDYDKPIDEEAEMYETYFLNLVDERDLMSLMSDEEKPTATPQIVYVTPEPTAEPKPTPVPTPVATDEPVPEKEKNPILGVVALVLIVAAGGGAAWWFVKSKGKNNQKKSSTGFDFDDEDEEEEDEEEQPDKES